MKKLLLLAIVSLLLLACGGDNTPTSAINPDGQFVASHSFQLSTPIDPTTMTLLLQPDNR